MNVSLDKSVNNFERTLSTWAATPVIGTIPAAIKVAFGTVQAIVALACAVFEFVPAAVSGNWDFEDYYWSHVEHGIGNMVAGAFEAIPFVGLAIYCYKELSRPKHAVDVLTGQEDKWMPYTSLEDQEWEITGLDNDAIAAVTRRYEEYLSSYLQDSLSRREKLNFAQAALRDYIRA